MKKRLTSHGLAKLILERPDVDLQVLIEYEGRHYQGCYTSWSFVLEDDINPNEDGRFYTDGLEFDGNTFYIGERA